MFHVKHSEIFKKIHKACFFELFQKKCFTWNIPNMFLLLWIWFRSNAASLLKAGSILLQDKKSENTIQININFRNEMFHMKHSENFKNSQSVFLWITFKIQKNVSRETFWTCFYYCEFGSGVMLSAFKRLAAFYCKTKNPKTNSNQYKFQK